MYLIEFMSYFEKTIRSTIRRRFPNVVPLWELDVKCQDHQRRHCFVTIENGLDNTLLFTINQAATAVAVDLSHIQYFELTGYMCFTANLGGEGTGYITNNSPHFHDVMSALRGMQNCLNDEIDEFLGDAPMYNDVPNMAALQIY